MNESELLKAFSDIDEENIEKAFSYHGKKKKPLFTVVRYVAAAAAVIFIVVMGIIVKNNISVEPDGEPVGETIDETYPPAYGGNGESEIAVNGRLYFEGDRYFSEIPGAYTECVNDQYTGNRNVYYSSANPGLVYSERNNERGIVYREYLRYDLVTEKYIYYDGRLYEKCGIDAEMPTNADCFISSMEYIGKTWVSISYDYPEEKLEMNGRTPSCYDGASAYLDSFGRICVVFTTKTRFETDNYCYYLPV